VRIQLTSVYVDDQEKALAFYTDVLGFQKKQDFPVGQFKWLTVVSPEDPDGVQLLLEPDEHPAAKAFKAALFAQGMPMATFFVDDIRNEAERMKRLGVVFTMEPTQIGPTTVAIFDDTCGNLIQLTQI
jgi:catechol 2,3-dioxygenase-like lactoylglutathione lyase family enzyme